MTSKEEKKIEEIRSETQDNAVLFVVYDRVAKEYAEPKMFVNKGCAVRWFNELVKKSPYPADDFELSMVGEFNRDTGEMVAYKKPDLIQRGLPDEV